jgi:hypothetical protein
LDPFISPSRSLFGRFGRLSNIDFLLGWLFRTGYGFQISLLFTDGPISRFVSFANASQRPPCISYSNVTTLGAYGQRLHPDCPVFDVGHRSWSVVCNTATAHPKELRSATTLITWNIWKERNSRVFSNTSSMLSMVMERIKEEAKECILARARQLAEITT